MNKKNKQQQQQKIETVNSIYFWGKSHFEDDDTQNYIVFQMAYRYFKAISNNDANILSWKSKELSDESIKPPYPSNKMLNPSLNYVGAKGRVEFKWDCLKKEKISFDHGKVVNIYIVYEINKNDNITSYPTLENCLLGADKLTKYIGIDQ